MEFLTILEKLLLKIEPSEITSFFYNNFFRFGGGGNVHYVPPGGAYGKDKIIIICEGWNAEKIEWE